MGDNETRLREVWEDTSIQFHIFIFYCLNGIGVEILGVNNLTIFEL